MAAMTSRWWAVAACALALRVSPSVAQPMPPEALAREAQRILRTRCMGLSPALAVPCVRGDWFIAAASRAPLYDLLLDLPSTRAELEQRLDVDVAANLRDFMAHREGGAEAHAELLARERRTMYVAMTRAMRALLVVSPDGPTSQLLQGFTSPRWNTGAKKGS